MKIFDGSILNNQYLDGIFFYVNYTPEFPQVIVYISLPCNLALDNPRSSMISNKMHKQIKTHLYFKDL